MDGRLESFDGVGLHYEEEGIGEPVVLLHGLSSSTHGNWKDPGIWRALRDAGRRVIGIDARGHGRSEKPHDSASYSGDAMVRDVVALLDLLGVERADVAGYSMGAGTALRFSIGYTDRVHRLVLGGVGGDPAAWGSGRSEMARRWLAGIEADDPSTIEDPVAHRARRVFEARGNDLQAIAALLRSHGHLTADLAGALEKVKVPTLVVCGDRDAVPGPLAEALPDAEALVLEGDHESVVGNPDLARAIVRFLSG